MHSEVPADSLVDTQLLVDWLGFVARSVWRHRILAVATCLVAFGAVWIAAAQWPKTYQSYGRLLVQRNDVMSSLVNPGRTIPREDSAPTWAAQEIVRSRQNLLAIMKETNLLEEWERSRTPLQRLKDWMVGWLRGPTTETARVEALAGLMEERIQVTTDDEGIVSFTVRWPNASMAYQLVDKAMRNFLEYRRVSEISAIEDSIAILDRSVGEIEAQVNMTIAELRRRERGAPTPRRQVRTPQPVPRPSGKPPPADGPLSGVHGPPGTPEIGAGAPPARDSSAVRGPGTTDGRDSGQPLGSADRLHRGPPDCAGSPADDGAVVA